MPPCRIAVTKGTSSIELDGDEEFVERHLTALLPFVVGRATPVEPREGSGSILPVDEVESGPDRQSLRSFLGAKSPRNSYDGIACVLFFARSVLGKPELTAEEIRAFLIQGRQHPPGAMAQALADAKRRYGFVEPGARKGHWRLAHGGEVRVELELPGGAEQP